MQGDPILYIVDQFIRYVILEAARMLVWIPAVVGVAYLHARWTSYR